MKSFWFAYAIFGVAWWLIGGSVFLHGPSTIEFSVAAMVVAAAVCFAMRDWIRRLKWQVVAALVGVIISQVIMFVVLPVLFGA